MGKRFFLNVGLISNQMNCFRSAKIQELNYNSNRAPVSWVTGVGSGAGMFAYADIGLLNIGEDVEHLELPISVSGNAKCFSNFGKKGQQIPIKLNQHLPCDPKIKP